MIDSKDAKAKVQADVSPVQKPGKKLCSRITTGVELLTTASLL